MNLRELTDDQAAILAQVESGDFTLDDVSDHLDMLAEDRNNKIESYLHVINRLESEALTVNAEMLRLAGIKATKAKALENIKGWLLMSMQDGEKHEFDLFKVSRVKGRQVVNVIDDKKIPMKFQECKPESWHVNKRELLAEMKKGLKVEGAELLTGNPSLRIK
jgi:hypothetical protein